MSRVAVNLIEVRELEVQGKRPVGLADRCIAHADCLTPNAESPRYAKMSRETWEALLAGRQPRRRAAQTPNFGDPRPDPIKDRPCCDPPT